MNHQPTVVIVTSKDGVHFSVQSSTLNAAFEQAFAKHRTAAELEAHGDFQRIKSLDDLLAPTPPARPKLTLIQGGKS